MSSQARRAEKKKEWLEWAIKYYAENAEKEAKFRNLVNRLDELGLDPYLLK